MAWREDFESRNLQLGWYRKSELVYTSSRIVAHHRHLDTPFTDDYSLSERPNYLRLYGGPYSLSVPACPTLFLRKQVHRICTWETKLSFKPTSEHTEAGTVLWWNHFTYSSVGVRKQDGARILRFRPSEGDVVEKELGLTSDVTLSIECGSVYRFGFRELESSEICWIGTVSNKAATKAPPIGASFTGMMLGLYSFGDRQRCLVPADFEYAQFQ